MSIWKPESVNVEPLTTMSKWQVFEVSSEDVDTLTKHIVGYCGEGRVSSRIVAWDEVTRIATTRSGRQYKLPAACSGVNLDAMYVWTTWKHQNKITVENNVTEEYE